MKYLSKKLISDLRNKVNIIHNSEKYDSTISCRKLISNRIQKNAQIHSYRIEHPYSKVPFSVPRNTKKRNIKKGIKNIENAFNWGVQHFNPSDFDESFIREIAGRITPELYDTQIAQYRDMGTTITGAKVTPPYPYKLINYSIPSFIESLKKQFNCEDIISKIETAIFTHLHIARLHPFVDGNGRTARILQDIILNYYGVPAPLIEPGERHIYSQCIDNAVIGWDEKKAFGQTGISEREKIFYEFIANRINSSYDQLIKKCRK